mmetsp:Transcript_343/g.1533  ORF Transcript_343/g.1533 Transcript_343/m.1533 type:complete len:376 (-) Transcript_343:68-1195(-)
MAGERQYGRNVPELGAIGQWDDKQVDAHRYLVGRERAFPDMEKEGILGRQAGDAEQLFPKFTTASVTTTGQVQVNGKTLNLWTFQQLEPLSAPVLRQRANVLRDAVGEDKCAPMPGQKQDLIKWIINMQFELTSEVLQTGRGGTTGAANAVPQSFVQESQAARERQQHQSAPFGPRRGQGHDGTRDHYNDLLLGRNEYSEEDRRNGIVSNRAGGEGRRHLQPDTHMASFGVSTVDRPSSPSKRYLGCDDHLMAQKKDLQAGLHNAVSERLGLSTRASDNGPSAHPSDSSLVHHGVSETAEQAPIGGERRRHAQVPDRMVNVGTAEVEDNRFGHAVGRKKLDSFAGSKFNQSHEAAGYQSSWKKDPSKLRGSSLIC